MADTSRDSVFFTLAQYPLHHVIFASAKFKVAAFDGSGEDTITRNVTDGQMYRHVDGVVQN